jgi:membrane protein involved in colicin uptake
MSFWISGAVLVGAAYNAQQAKSMRKDAERQQSLALQQQQAQSEAMRLEVQKQTDVYRQQGASLQQQADIARQSFEAQQLQYSENKLAMESKAREVQAAADEERRKAAAAEASALKARTRGGKRSLLSGERMDAELGLGMDLNSSGMRLQ